MSHCVQTVSNEHAGENRTLASTGVLVLAYLLERQIRGIGRLSLGVCMYSTPKRDTKSWNQIGYRRRTADLAA